MEVSLSQQQKQHLIDLPKVIAGGIASPSAALLTSRFGVAGTMVGLALSAVVVTVISDVLKVYLQRAPGAVTRIEGGFTKRPRWQRPFYRLRHPFSKFSSLSPAQRRSILIRSVIAGVIMFVVGVVIVTGFELSVGKNLSCWVWKSCPTGTSADGSSASNTTTLPSIFGGGRSTGSNPLQIVAPVPVQQQPTPPPGSQGTLKQPSVPVSGQPSSSSSTQKQNSPSEGEQQNGYEQTTSSQQGEYQQQSSYEQTTESPQQDEYQQQSANQQQTNNSEQTTENPQQQGEYQQQNPPSKQESQQPTSSSSNPADQQQNSSSSSSSDQQKASQREITISPALLIPFLPTS